MIDEIQLEAEEHMTASVEHTREQLVTIRTGRANPAMFNGLVAEYYGVPTPITQMATISVPEPRMLLIKPYEQSMIHEIENSIRNSDLGVNPTNDGQVLRVQLVNGQAHAVFGVLADVGDAARGRAGVGDLDGLHVLRLGSRGQQCAGGQHRDVKCGL